MSVCLTPEGVDISWLEQKLPYIPVNILDDVVSMIHRHGKEALGVFYNGIIELSNTAPKTVAYHEGFHAVFNSYLTKEQRDKILKDTRKSEEQLADGFEDYKEYDIKPNSNILLDFFKKLKFWIKEKLGLLTINDLYSAIDDGYFKNRKPFKYTGNPKFKTVTDFSQKDLKLITESLLHDNLNYIAEQQGVVNKNIYYIDWSKLTGGELKSVVEDSIEVFIENTESEYLKNKFTDNNKIIIKNLILNRISKILNIDIVIEDDLSEAKDYPVELWDKNPLQQEMSNKFNAEFKMFLENIPAYEWKDGQLQLKANELGYPYAVDSGIIMANLYQDMSNLGNLEDMKKVLEAKKSSKPYYQYILNTLNDNSNNKSVIINGIEFISNKFENQFFSSMANYLAEISSYTIDIKEEEIDRIKIKTVDTRTRSLNTTGANQNILNDWQSTVQQLTNTEGLKARLDTFIINYDNKITFENANDYTDKLSKLNIDIDPRVFEGVKKENLINFNKNLFVPENLTEASKALRFFANKQRDYSDINPNMVTGSSGDLLNAVTNYTPMRRFFEKLKKSKDFLEKITQDTFYQKGKNSSLEPNKTTLKIVESNNIIADGDTDTHDYSKMSEFEWEIFKLNAYFNRSGKTEGKIADTPTIIPSDKGNINVISYTKETLIEDKPEHNFGKYHNFKRRLLDSFIIPELLRIQEVREISLYLDALKAEYKINPTQELNKKIKDLDIKNYYNNGKWFMFFPNLNKWLETKLDENKQLIAIPFSETLSSMITDDTGNFQKSSLYEELNVELDNMINSVFTTDMDYFSDLNILSQNEKGNIVKSDLLDSSMPTNKTFYANYFANTYVKNLETTLANSGDIAFYKPAVDKKGNFDIKQLINNNFTDVNKRAGQSQVPSRTLADGKYSTVIVKSMEKDSVNKEFYISRLGTLGNKYGGIDVTDAATFITTKRYIQILTSKGDDGYNKLQALKRVSEGKSLDYKSDLDLLMQPLKGFHFGLIPTELTYLDSSGQEKTTVKNIPTQIKNAQIPLIPAFTERYPELDHLRKRMEESEIDELVFDSAFKDGTRKVHSADEISRWLKKEVDSELSILTLSHDNYGEVLDIPIKKTISETFSSQKQRLSLANVDNKTMFTVDGKSINGEQLKNTYSRAIKSVLENQFYEFNESIKTDGNLDIDKVRMKLKKLIDANSSDEFSLYWDDLLKNLTQENLYTLDLPQNKDKIYSLIASDFNKSVLDIDMAGKSAVLVSTYGIMYKISEPATNFDNTLHAATLYDSKTPDNIIERDYNQIIREYKRLGIPTDNVDIKELLKSNPIVSSDEVIITPEYFIKSLKKKGIDPTIFMDDKGNLIVDNIPESLRFVSFHRIPYQGKNSNAKAYIKDFSNISQSSVIYFNPDILTRSGGDFDIDKVFIEFYDYKIEDNTWILSDNPKNTILDIHLAVAGNSDTYNELITPNNSDDLDGIISELESLKIIKDNTSDIFWWSNKKQSDFKKANKAGKDLIGIYSIFNVFHGMAQLIKPTSVLPVKIGQTEKAILEHSQMGGTYDFSGKLISDNYQTLQTAAVDNAKEPKLGKLNHNMFTAPLKGYLLAHGVSLDIVEKFTNNPLYLSVTKYYNQFELTEGFKATQLAFEKTAKDFNLEVFYFTDPSKINNDVKPLGNDVLDINANTLYSLMYHHNLAQEFNKFNYGLRLSNNGIKNNLAENTLNFDKYQNDFKRSEYFKFDEAAFNKSWLKEYELQVDNFLNISSSLTSHHSSFYNFILQRADELGIRLNSREQVQNFFNDLSHYLTTKNKKLTDSYSGTIKIQGVEVDKNSYLVNEFPNAFNSWKKEKLSGIYKENLFLKNIEVFKDSKTDKTGLRMRKLKDINIDDVIASTEDLFNNEPKVMDFLFGYVYKRYGFSKVKTSPMKYMEKLFENYNINSNYESTYNKLMSNNFDTTLAGTDEFITQFALNNPSQVRFVKEPNEYTTGIFKVPVKNKKTKAKDTYIIYGNTRKMPYDKSEGVLNYNAESDIFVQKEEKQKDCEILPV